MSLTTVSTSVKINKNVAGNSISPKQYCWLENAIADYSLTLDLDTITTVGEASKHITHIQSAINSGKLKKTVESAPVVNTIWYAVIQIESVVSIKTFIGTRVEAVAKSYRVYGTNVKNVTDVIEDAKSLAIELRNNLIIDEVAITTKTELEALMDNLDTMDIPALRQLASDLGVDLGRSKARNTIIARILA
jgi:hypothetical protein